MPEGTKVPVDLHIARVGSGPPVVLLHGLGGDHTVWNEVLPDLGTQLSVFAPDLRGHGQTPGPAGSTYSFPELQGDVVRMMDRESIDSAHLVGLSAGGFLSLALALDSPARIRSLVLIGAAAHCDAHTRAVGENWAETYRKDGYDAYILRLLKDLYSPDWMEAHLDYADRLRAQEKNRNLDGPIRWGLAIHSFDVRGRLAKIKAPTLVVQGMDDQVVDASHARLLRQAIPGSELKLFPNTGHLVPIEHPREIAEAARGWIVRAEDSRRTPS